jgi:hypothetical protein
MGLSTTFVEIGRFGLGLMPGMYTNPSHSKADIPVLNSRLVMLCTSHWICAAKARHGQTQSPELTALHLRCERLAHLPITPNFVFDGSERPHVKRDKIVRGDDHWLVGPFKQLLDCYGFQHSLVCAVCVYFTFIRLMGAYRLSERPRLSWDVCHRQELLTWSSPKTRMHCYLV